MTTTPSNALLAACLLGPLAAALVRPERAPPAAPAPLPRVVRWIAGDGPKRLMPADRGFCYLSGIGGNLEGGGEAVRVYVDDGVWWLVGRSCQPSLWAEATCVVWPSPGPAPAGAVTR